MMGPGNVGRPRKGTRPASQGQDAQRALSVRPQQQAASHGRIDPEKRGSY